MSEGGPARPAELRALGPSERWYYLVDGLSPLNTVGLFRVKADKDDSEILEIFRSLREELPLLGCRIAEGTDGVLRFEPSEREADIQIVSAAPDDALIEAELGAPFDVAAGPLYRGRVARQRDGEIVIVLVVSHIVTDGIGGIGIVRRILHRLAGSAPARQGLVPASLEEALPAVAWWKRWLGFAGMQLRALWSALRYRPLRLLPETSLPPSERRSKVRSCTLPAGVHGALVARAEAEGCSLHGVLCAVVAEALAAPPHDRPFSLGSPVNLRPALKMPVGDAAGAYVSVVVTRQGTRGPLWERARDFSQQIRPILSRGEPVLALVPLPRLCARPRSRAAELVPMVDRMGPGNVTISTLGQLALPARLPEGEAHPEVELLDLKLAASLSVTGIFCVITSALGDRLQLTFTWVPGLLSDTRAQAIIARCLEQLEQAASSKTGEPPEEPTAPGDSGRAPAAPALPDRE